MGGGHQKTARAATGNQKSMAKAKVEQEPKSDHLLMQPATFASNAPRQQPRDPLVSKRQHGLGWVTAIFCRYIRAAGEPLTQSADTPGGDAALDARGRQRQLRGENFVLESLLGHMFSLTT